MARKKRKVLKEFQEPVKDDKPKKIFQDEFQSTLGKRIENLSNQIEGRGKTVTYTLAALAVLILLGGIFYVWNKRANNSAQTALGKAIETSQAKVSDSPLPAGSTEKTFKTEKERAEAAINEFQAVADKFGGQTADKAKYFIAVNRLGLDRPAAIQELTDLSQKSGEVGFLSKFALAQAQATDGKLDEAAALYSDLAALDNAVLPKTTINFELAKIYEKQGKKAEAADIYFNIAKVASEAKDADGKPVPMSQTARESKEKVEELNPEKAKEIVEPAPESPAGGFPMG